MSPAIDQPIGVFGRGRLAELLEPLSWKLELVTIESLRRGEAETPRLLLVDAPAIGKETVPETIRALRAIAPLTDVVVWAPGASAELVRQSLRAEAGDVVLKSSSENLSQVIENVLNGQRFLPRIERLASQRSRGSRYEGMVSRSHRMWDLFEHCDRIAPTTATVLIEAETGTGKELLARAIHRRSQRGGRFVPVNCSGLTESLVEAQLFGHEKGAFTGAASASKGLVRHADGGTLFLDEVGDMPHSAQLNLLRLLQEGTVLPVGSHRESEVDVRVVAATHVQLDQAVSKGSFRADLYYRLDVIRLVVPPLRERREDIVYLCGYFLKRLSKHYSLPQPRLSDGFLDELVRYDWPGNVRQLENFVERVVLGSRASEITRADFARLLRPGAGTPEARQPSGFDARLSVDPARTLQDNLEPALIVLERRYLEELLKRHHGRIAASAEQAGISRRTLLRKLRSHGIDKEHFRH